LITNESQQLANLTVTTHHYDERGDSLFGGMDDTQSKNESEGKFKFDENDQSFRKRDKNHQNVAKVDSVVANV
jgi:hypothetical protein